MENLKLPVTVIGVVILQIGGFIYWIGQQAATISDLEETVSQLGSRMAIEDNVNLRRDVSENTDDINELWTEVDDLWDTANSMSSHMTSIMTLQQRVAILENTLSLTGRLNGKDGM